MTFASRPATKENLRLRNDSSNEFLTRSNVNQQRVSHSFRRAPRSFQIRSPTSLTLVPTSFALVPNSPPTSRSHSFRRARARSRFATHGRDQQRTGNHRAQRAPQQGAEEKNSTALRYHVCRVSALCHARNFRSRSNLTMGCAHAWMSGRAYQSSLSMSRPVYRLKTSADTLKTVRTRPSRSTSDVVNSLPSSPAQARHSDLRTNYKQFRLKTITSQIENQPANHARSTNVHRATHAHAETMHTVRIVRDFKTKNSLAFNPAASHRLVTIIDASDFSCVLLHYEAYNLHSTNRRFASSPNSFVSGIMLSLDTRPSFDLTP